MSGLLDLQKEEIIFVMTLQQCHKGAASHTPHTDELECQVDQLVRTQKMLPILPQCLSVLTEKLGDVLPNVVPFCTFEEVPERDDERRFVHDAPPTVHYL